jgi:DNA ligase-associated metallophosphoesterase
VRRVTSDPVQPVLFAGVELVLDLSGALWWPAQRLLAVADLHLEKGSSFAARGGRLLPPYDTAMTLRRLGAMVQHYRPETVLCLGDSFHDREAGDRLGTEELATLRRLTQSTDWLWLTGNHDPSPPSGLGGQVREEISLGPLVFRHQAGASLPGPREGEVSGHFHPVAALSLRGKSLRRRCFAVGRRRLVMPAFGAYAGGLNVLDRAFAGLFPGGFEAHVMGERRLHRLASGRLRPDYYAERVLAGD